MSTLDTSRTARDKAKEHFDSTAEKFGKEIGAKIISLDKEASSKD